MWPITTLKTLEYLMNIQFTDNQLATKILELKSIINQKYDIPQFTLQNIAEQNLADHIIEIHSKSDFSEILKSYELENQFINNSLTGDFFTDHPSLGHIEVDGYICITL